MDFLGAVGVLPEYVDITGCDSSGCSVRNGQTVNVTGVIIPGLDAERLQLKGWAEWGPFVQEMVFTDSERNVCNHIEFGCPIHKSENVTFGLETDVSSPISGITPRITISVNNGTSNVIVFCFKTYIRID